MNTLIQPKSLRDIIKLDKGKPPAQQNYYGPDATIYLTPDYLRGGAQPEQVKPSLNAIHVKDGETIILWDGSNAGEIFRSKQGVLASTMAKVNHSKDYDSTYFFYALKGLEDYLKGQTSGSGIPHVDKEILGKLLLFEFPKPEQSKIAEVLSTVDQAIEQTEALIAKQQRIKTGLMQDLLTRGIDEHGNLRSEETHEFKDSSLGRISVEWEVKTIDDLACHVGSGVTPTGGESVYSKEGVLFIRSQNVYFDSLHLFDVAFISSEIHRVMKRSEVFENDILLNITGASIGRCCRMPKRDGYANVNQHVCAIRLAECDKYRAAFLNTVLSSPIGQSQIAQFNAGGNREGLNYQQVRAFKIPWPKCPKEFNRIEEVFARERKMAYRTVTILAKLRSLKTALMQDLLTGKVRVTPLLEKTEDRI